MNINRVEIEADKILGSLPHILYYHNRHHTHEVVAAAIYLAKHYNISHEEVVLLKTAALLHDVGFINSITGFEHEQESCRIAKPILEDADYTESEIGIVEKIILSTVIPQSPGTLLEEIMCDADLYYLGTDQFYEKGNLLYKELLALQKIKDEKEWYGFQIDFLSSHRYFTKTAQQLLQMQKQIHLQSIIKKRDSLV